MRLRSRDVPDVAGEQRAAAAGIKRAATEDPASSHNPQEQNPGQQLTRSQTRQDIAVKRQCQGLRGSAASGWRGQPAGGVDNTKTRGDNSLGGQLHLHTAVRDSATLQIQQHSLTGSGSGTGEPTHDSAHLKYALQQAAPQPPPDGSAQPPSNVQPPRGQHQLCTDLRKNAIPQIQQLGNTGSGTGPGEPTHDQQQTLQQAAPQPAPASSAPRSPNAQPQRSQQELRAAFRKSAVIRFRSLGPVDDIDEMGQPVYEHGHVNHAPQQAAHQPVPAGFFPQPPNVQPGLEDVSHLTKRPITMPAYIASIIETSVMESFNAGIPFLQQKVRNFVVLICPTDFPSWWRQVISEEMVKYIRNSGVPISSLAGTHYEVQIYLRRNAVRRSMGGAK